MQIKGNVMGTEEMGETLVLTLSSLAGKVSDWQFLPALMQEVQRSKEQRGGSLRCFGYTTHDFALWMSLFLCGCLLDFKTFLLFML